MPVDFEKAPSDRRVGFWLAPTGDATGIANVGEPLAAEINNTGGASGAHNAASSVSWNDWSFGVEASETLNEPSLADSSTYEEFGQSNYGGSVSFYYPRAYDDASNPISLTYDLVDVPGSLVDAVTRIDGDVLQSAPAANGDFVSVYRVRSDAEANPFTPGESKRYTKTFGQKSDFSHFVVVGDHAITTIPATTDTPEPGETGRFRAAQQGRDVTNYLQWSTSDVGVIEVYPGGFYNVVGADTDTATITVSDPETSDTATISVTVTA